ncbi:MAG: RagB/SusD family nutrient uptake outer membrane protein [Sphingobacteriales bacterium]|nr:MAG: RagB/SusD family nutrient uptake outer membrane protein [Sphingobacteriales bacterium]
MKKVQFKIYKPGKKYNLYLLSAAVLALSFTSCKKDLDVKNPNNPTFETNVTTLNGLTSYAKGATYWNGFAYGNGWLGDSYFSLPWGYRELMGDEIGGGQGSNNQTTTMGVPDKFQADPSDATTVFTNPSPQALSIIRVFNTRAASANANNALFYQWNSMYGMINSCNLILENMGRVKSLSADQANTVKAWAYWWKGFAYAEIGSLYYAGLLIDNSYSINNKYVSKETVIAESNKYLSLAATTLAAITNQGAYNGVISALIPAQCQTGLGAPPSVAEWTRSINTLLARNILVNHLAPFVNGNPSATINKASIPVMATADWNAVISLCNNGVKNGDHVFTGRTTDANSFFSSTGGSVASLLTASNQTTTYKLSERLVQQFKSGDARRANFSTANGTFFGDANTNTTRYSLVDGVAKGFTGFQILGSRQVGGLEIYIGPTYEENALMLAEAKIRTGAIDAGLSLVDGVRQYQGAGVAAVSGTGLTLAQALTELSMERLAALAFRGMSYYDTRRWGWTYAIANGGGRYGCVINYKGNWYTNATIDYNFMDYWDVPADESDLNPPSTDSAPIKNPNW